MRRFWDDWAGCPRGLILYRNAVIEGEVDIAPDGRSFKIGNVIVDNSTGFFDEQLSKMLGVPTTFTATGISENTLVRLADDADAPTIIAREEEYADRPDSLPAGYRWLVEGETTAVGDIYWSTKWYRVGETMESVPVPKEWCGLYARPTVVEEPQ